MCLLAAALAVSAGLAFTPGGEAWAQTPVCGTPGEGERVECKNADANSIDIDLDGVDITTTDDNESAVYLYKQSGGSGAIDLSIAGSSIENTASSTDDVVLVRHDGAGDIGLRIRDSSITSLGSENGIRVWTTNRLATGAIDIQLDDARLSSVSGANILVNDIRSGGIRIRARDSILSGTGRNGRGILAEARRGGALEIVISGGSIETVGDGGGGIVALKSETGAPPSADPIRVSVDGVTIKTAGGASATGHFSRTVFGSHGIAAEHRGSGSVDVSVRGGSIDVSGAGQHGIAVGGISFDDNTLFATSVRDEDGYRRQTVRVDGPVQGGSGNGAGVYLAGGGRVIIGPNGRVGALSGTAIRAAIRTGRATADDPKLYVELRPGGRRIADILGGSIVNEGGASYSTMAVNGVVLMDGGVVLGPRAWAPNGARDVALRTGTDGADIAVADFLDRWAPRAAVYEALPGFLLRLDEAGGPGVGGGDGRLRSPGTPVWARIEGGVGSYRPDSATVGARYSYDRYSVETGMDFDLDDDLAGWAGLRLVSGSARVNAPTGGGRIEAAGYGLIAGLAWEGEDDWYGEGQLSLTRYSADLFSATRGSLKSGVSGMVHALGLEGGRRFDLDLGVKTRLTARGLLRSSGVSLDEFNDGLFSQVSIEEADRLAAGAGVVVETGLLPEDGVDRLVLHGSLEAEQVLTADSSVDVTGAMLESEAGGIGFDVGFGGTFLMDGYTLGGSIQAGGLLSDDRAYATRIDLRIRF